MGLSFSGFAFAVHIRYYGCDILNESRGGYVQMAVKAMRVADHFLGFSGVWFIRQTNILQVASNIIWHCIKKIKKNNLAVS